MIAIIGGIVIFWYTSDLKEKIPENIDYDLMFVAGTDIKKGEKITGESIETREIPANIFSGKFIIDKDEIVGKKVTVDISEGEIITKEKLEGVGSGNDFSSTFSSYVPYDLRAVSIPVNFYGDKSLLEAGDNIDLISTYYEQESGVLYSETVLSGKEIILIGNSNSSEESYSGNENDGRGFLLDPVITSGSESSNYGNLLILTFYLSQSEAEEIFLALERGAINLSVCSRK